MKTTRIITTGLASLAAILLVGSAPTQAANVHRQEISYTELESRLSALESELSTQRVEFSSDRNGVVPVSYGYADCGNSVCDSGCTSSNSGYGRGNAACGCPAWYAGYEITFLKPYISDNEFAGGWDDEYGVGHRFVTGYDSGTGLGGRVRYWMYNHNHQNAAGEPFLNIDMDAVDAEITLQERMRNWDLLVSGGARYGRAGFAFDTSDFYFEGVGPTVSLEATRFVGNRGVYLIGNFRTSILFGHIAGTPALFDAEDETTIVLENQLGIGWSRQLGNGLLNVRSVWESQYWINNSLGDDIYGITSPIAFAGPTSSVEFRF